jgi:hypothetical protein
MCVCADHAEMAMGASPPCHLGGQIDHDRPSTACRPDGGMRSVSSSNVEERIEDM